ncbi:MAG: hypothetical protein IPM76_27750 [Chloroflexi bacterium]|nr:hypothetical protein [Chloroflexota bacterium]
MLGKHARRLAHDHQFDAIDAVGHAQNGVDESGRIQILFVGVDVQGGVHAFVSF